MRNILRLGIFLIWGAAVLFGTDQTADTTTLRGPYLGQKPPGKTAEIFAPGVISGGHNEHGISFTPDGKELYYRLLGDPFSVTVYMRETNGRWTRPRVAPFSGRYSAKSSLSPDGNTLMFSSGQPAHGKLEPTPFWTIWKVERDGPGWGKPKHLGHLHGACPSISSLGNIYFFARGANGKGDIFVSRYRNGAHLQAEKVPAPISTGAWENDPYIAPDESYLIIQSDRDDESAPADLYISFRDPHGAWMEPINMGRRVNSKESGEGCPWVTPDGKYLFFSSIRSVHRAYSESPVTLEHKIRILSGPGGGSEDIYWIDAKIIDELRGKHQ